ncbi:MAG: aldehyde dehydrogenase family protein, partial [Bdellovibrionales bacterium]|nr:aldehyde dehydrogenase family protein [Bdellovibrionales bacterium]
LLNCSYILKKHKKDFATLITKEMGKLYGEAVSEVEKCVWLCEYYAETGEDALADFSDDSEASKSYVCFRPLGVILGVMPWNFPFWQVFRFAIPAIFAGNATLIKHSPNVPGCSIALEKLFRDAGVPPHVFRSLLIPTDLVEELIEHTSIQGVALTGSVEAGKAVASIAARNIKKSVLELGGNDPYIILADVKNLEKVVDCCLKSRLTCNGQSCIAAKRIIIIKEIRETFEKMLLDRMSQINVGDPFDAGTALGPLARADLRDKLHEQIGQSVAEGASLKLGGEIPKGNGFFYPATVLSNVHEGVRAFEDELFGPVAVITEADDEHEAIRLANASRFGLGAAIFTDDLSKGERIARNELRAGTCSVNGIVKSDPRFPFGGIKESGFGRELSQFGIREFTNVKTVHIS